MRGDQAREISITIHQTTVALALDRPKVSRRGSGQGDSPKGSKSDPLRLAFVAGYERDQERAAWQGGENGLLEHMTSEIAVEVVLAAEVSYREGCISDHEWRVQRKARLEEELRQHQLELERPERERQEKLEQARVDRLLDEANSLRRAADIRTYVHAVEHAIEREGINAPADDLARWVRWALEQADRIYPVKNGRFLQGYEGDDSSEE